MPHDNLICTCIHIVFLCVSIDTYVIAYMCSYTHNHTIISTTTHRLQRLASCARHHAPHHNLIYTIIRTCVTWLYAYALTSFLSVYVLIRTHLHICVNTHITIQSSPQQHIDYSGWHHARGISSHVIGHQHETERSYSDQHRLQTHDDGTISEWIELQNRINFGILNCKIG